MSVLQYPDAINAPELQIWNNAAFDDEDTDETAAIKASWCPSQPFFVNRSETMESDSTKENKIPELCKSPVSVKSPMPTKPLNPNGAIINSQGKPLKLLFKQGLLIPSPTISDTENETSHDESNIDSEIQEIETQIKCLSSKLEALRLVKAEYNLKAKCMEQKQSSKNPTPAKKTEQLPSVSTSTKKVQRRGISLGPSEIFTGARFRQTSKPETTPIQSIQSRRRSCYWKLQEIDEQKVTTQRGRRSLSLSPKPRQSVSKTQVFKQGFTTIGSKKSVKRDYGIISCIQPKKLFKEGEKSVPAKKPIKNGRVIASRYTQIPIQSAGNLKTTDRRKRSLPENEIEDSKRRDKKQASSVGKTHWFVPESTLIQGNENQVKKRWQIPREEIMGHKSSVDSFSPSILKMPNLLPKIRTTVCCTNESPRDSGAARRVAELDRRKSYFGNNETSVCQALSFDKEEEE